MKQNWICGILLAAAFLMCGTSFASPQSNGIYSEPIYDNAFVLATWPPLVPANKLNNSAFIAMAGSTDNDKETATNCMAACHSGERTSVGLSYSQLTTGFKPALVACGYESEPVNLSAKIPISI